MQRCRIVSDGTPHNTHVFLDGVELQNIKHIKVEIGTNERMLATVTAVVYIDELEINGNLRIERFARDVARMTNQEALERALLLVGELGASEIQQHLIELISKATGAAPSGNDRGTFGP